MDRVSLISRSLISQKALAMTYKHPGSPSPAMFEIIAAYQMRTSNDK